MRKFNSVLFFAVFFVFLFMGQSYAQSPLLLFGSSGTGNGEFHEPSGITIDSSGNILVADTKNHRIQKFDSSGNYLTQFGSSGTGNGEFNQPSGITIDSSGNILVADTKNHRIQKFTNDNTAPTAAITYSTPGPYKSGSTITITATFSEAVTDSPVPQIAISGANTLSASDMTKVSSTVYTYSYTIGSGDGNSTVVMSAAVDAAGNGVTATPTSGSSFVIDNTAPVIVSAAIVKENIIQIFFSEQLDTTTIQKSDFSVSDNTITSFEIILTGGKEIEITLDTPLSAGDSPSFTITDSSITDLAGNPISSTTITPVNDRITVSAPPIPSDTSFTLSSDSGGSMIPIGEKYALSTININDSVTTPLLKFDPTTFDSSSGTATSPTMLTMTSSAGTVVLQQNTQIVSSGWDGKLLMPKSTSVTVAGTTTHLAISFGASDRVLTFSTPVKITLNGQTSRSAVLTEFDGRLGTIPACTVNIPSANDIQPSFPQACYVDDDVDLQIYTLTTSTFSSNSPLSSSASVVSSSGGGSTSGGSFSASTSVSSSGGPNGGFGGILQGRDEGYIRTLFVGDTLTIRLDMEKYFGDLKYMQLFFGDLKSLSTMASDAAAYVAYDKYSDVKIIDKNKIFDNVKLTTTEFDGHQVLFYDIKFKKSIETSDVGIYGWNENNNIVRESNSDVFSIIEKDSEILPKVKIPNQIILESDKISQIEPMSDYKLLPVTINAPEYSSTLVSITVNDENGISFDSKEFTLDKNGSYEFTVLIDHNYKPGTWTILAYAGNTVLTQKEFVIEEQSHVSETPQINPSIKQWVKRYVELWNKGVIDDTSFNEGLSFLIQNKIVDIPSTPQTLQTSEIPSWFKDKSNRWSNNEISDDDFLVDTNKLVEERHIGIN